MTNRMNFPWRCQHFALLLVLPLIVPSPIQAEESRPHIVLCMADDQGWGDMAYYGHPQLKTPTFDEMARTGLRLDRFYAAAPVCSPTRASVMTGRTPNRLGVFSWGHTIRPQEVTVAEVLRKHGYRTGHFGKWHLGSVLAGDPTSPGENGFDVWLSALNFFDVNPYLSREGTIEKFEGESSEIVVREALKFIRQNAEKDQPSLSVVWFGSPHNPHVGTPEDLALYPDAKKKERNFLAEVTAMDRAVGQLRSGLREIGIAENTLLWYCSDNGAIPQGSTGGLRGKKGNLYEGGLRVPCLIEWPDKITKPRRSDVLSGTVDIYPTLLDIVGATVENQPPLDGVSLLPLFEGKMQYREKPLGFWDADIRGNSTPSDKILSAAYAQQQAGKSLEDSEAHGHAPAPLKWDAKPGHFVGQSAWHDGDWKLLRFETKQGDVKWELYNLAKDPTESDDLSKDQPQRRKEMAQALDAWLASVADSLRGKDY